MLQVIGLIVVVYAIARLLQVPIENNPASNKSVLWLISIFAILIIGFLAMMLITAGGPSMPPM